jgi:hypothetical protein
MKRLITIFVVVAIPAALLAWLFTYDQRVKAAFPGIEIGMSAADATQALGAAQVTSCGKWGGEPPAGCFEEHAYPSLTAIWLVWFDRSRKVIGKQRVQAPWCRECT